MITEASLEILDLRHYSAPQLRDVLESEARLWRDRLHWDYRASVRLLLQYVDAHSLPGYVAVCNGHVLGYTFFVYDDTKAVIGDVFSMPAATLGESSRTPFAHDPHQVEQTLLRHIFETLLASPGVERIESQLLFHPSGLHTDLFREAGFAIYPRLFLARSLCDLRTEALPELPWDLDMIPWSDELLHQAGQLIAEAYHDHLDGRINDQYLTVHGSMRFLHNIVHYPGCGVFAAHASQVIVHRQTRELVALLLCSRISPESGHITQVCVHPDHRRRGLAKRLLAFAASNFATHGATEITLTVTARNSEAMALYREEGYRTLHPFDATVWQKG